MPKVSFTLPAEQYERIAARAAIAEQSVNDYVRDRLTASLTTTKPPTPRIVASTNSLARTTVEPRWKTKDLPKAKAKP